MGSGGFRVPSKFFLCRPLNIGFLRKKKQHFWTFSKFWKSPKKIIVFLMLTHLLLWSWNESQNINVLFLFERCLRTNMMMLHQGIYTWPWNSNSSHIFSPWFFDGDLWLKLIEIREERFMILNEYDNQSPGDNLSTIDYREKRIVENYCWKFYYNRFLKTDKIMFQIKTVILVNFFIISLDYSLYCINLELYSDRSERKKVILSLR